MYKITLVKNSIIQFFDDSKSIAIAWIPINVSKKEYNWILDHIKNYADINGWKVEETENMEITDCPF